MNEDISLPNRHPTDEDEDDKKLIALFAKKK
jgi:hypothetical protein